MCVLLGISSEFPVDPYYEPLAWFMIHNVCIRFICTVFNTVLRRHHQQGAVNIYNSPRVTVTNCTFYNNTSTGYFTTKAYQGASGGLSIGYSEQTPFVKF